MPYQCVHCGKFYEDATKELIEGCSECKGHFFYYVKKEKYEKMLAEKEAGEKEQLPVPLELEPSEKKKVEKDVREMIGIEEEEPVVLDLESVRVLHPGKFEIDIVKVFKRETPIIYKLEEGKYIIDLGKIINDAKQEQEK